MFNELSQAVFFGLVLETVLLILALRFPVHRKRIVPLIILTAVIGGIAYGPHLIEVINPPPQPTATPSPITLTDSVTHIYDDFNNPANDGGFDRSRWEVAEDPNGCDVAQSHGQLVIKHSPSSKSDYSGCFLKGALEGVAGSKFRLFEAKIMALNDFQGTCCSGIGLTLSSAAFSGGGGYIQCAIHGGPGFISGVMTITHGVNTDEYRRQVGTTYGNWHTLRLEIDQADYTVSCKIDGTLIGSVRPKDASDLSESTYSRYIGVGWPRDTSSSFQIDDVKIIP